MNKETTTTAANALSSLWDYLTDSQSQLVSVMTNAEPLPPAGAPGELEFGFVLYWLNTMTPELLLVIIRKMGLPPASQEVTDNYAAWVTQIDAGPGIVTGDGALISNIQYALLDKGWFEAILNYVILVGTSLLPQIEQDALNLLINGLLKDLFPNGLPIIQPFPSPTAPPVLTAPDTKVQGTLTVAIFGDWGASNVASATNTGACAFVASAINSLNPDVSIHLGDVYYAGTPPQEAANLIPGFPAATYNCTLNSNHEMYLGGLGLFGTALTDTSLFNVQHQASYFAIEYGNVILLGLDTAYFDTQEPGNFDLFMNGALYSSNDTADTNEQSDFVASLDLTGKTVIVLTHHNAISVDGSTLNAGGLTNQMNNLLGGRNPDFWYYGHIHNGIVYNNSSAQNLLPTATSFTQCRCFGNGAMPYGNGYWLHTADSEQTPITGIDYYASTLAGYSNVQMTNLVRNGFAMISIDLATGAVTETFYEANIDGTAAQVWPVPAVK